MNNINIAEAIFSSILEQDVKLVEGNNKTNEMKDVKEFVSLVYKDTGFSISYAFDQLDLQERYDSLPPLHTTIKIETDYGDNFPIKCSLSETVKNIKERIEDEHCIEEPSYGLFFNDVRLKEKDKLNAYKIRDNDCLLLKLEIKKFYILIQIHRAMTKILECKETDTLSMILKRLRDNFNIPNLIIETRHDMNEPLNSIGIKAGSKIFVRKAHFNGGDLTVKIPNGKSIWIRAGKDEIVETFKQTISNQEDISVDDIDLLYKGDYLENDQTLDYYEIQDRDTICMTNQQNVTISLNINRLTGRTTRVDNLKSSETIKNLKTKIFAISNEPVDMQCLVHDGKRLDNDKTLGDYKIKNNDTLSLAINVASRGDIKVDIRNLKGEIYSIKMNAEHTIEELKCRLNERLNVNLNTIVIAYKSRPLEDHKTLNHYRIENNARLNLLFRDNESISLPATNLLDSQYDFDFTNTNDTGKTYNRGSLPYLRPCGWKRIAIKSSNQYENNVWLGSSNKPGEWPVAYHGTDFEMAKNLFLKNYNNALLEALTFNRAHLTTQDIRMAEEFAKTINLNGIEIKFVIQSRVRPDKIVNNHSGTCMLIPSYEDLRPYGICYKIL